MGMGGIAPPTGHATCAHLLPGGLLLLSFDMIPSLHKKLTWEFLWNFLRIFM
jgi:hypothetical protein